MSEESRTEDVAEDSKSRSSDSKIMVIRFESDVPDNTAHFEGPFESKSDADKWISENAKEGYDYNVARIWPTVKVEIQTIRRMVTRYE